MSQEEIKKLAQETLDRRAKMRDYTRRYRSEHPDRVLKSKITSAIRLLENNGYSVNKTGDANG